jgi:hypothetical protein
MGGYGGGALLRGCLDFFPADANARHDALISSKQAPLVLAFAPILLFADGGSLVLRKQVGRLTISIFSAPQPLRVGSADLSVMVQETNDRSTILDATVKIHLIKSRSDGISDVSEPATHANADNKLLYAARVNLPSSGAWRVVADIKSEKGSGQIEGEINVLDQQPAIISYWADFALVPLIVLLFVINRWLKRNRVKSARRRPRLHQGP